MKPFDKMRRIAGQIYALDISTFFVLGLISGFGTVFFRSVSNTLLPIVTDYSMKRHQKRITNTLSEEIASKN
jgi:hypothetical protein